MHVPSSTDASYADWKAPAGDGEFLLWPAASDLLRDTHANAARFRDADAIRLQNVPLPEVRLRLRTFLGQPDATVPLIATGHQTALHHPGVWAKNVLIDAVATKLGGQAYHFAVDTDAPKHLLLKWPGTNGAGGAISLTDDPAAARDRWSGLLAPPTPAHLKRVAAQFEATAAAWSFRPLVPQLLSSMLRLSLECTNLPCALINALHELDWGLGLRHHALVTSPLCGSEPYLLFAHHLLSRAGDFAADYNAALDAYRQKNKIRSPGRPMPNLQCAPGRCEAPFWIDDLSTGARTRAWVERAGDGWALRASNDGRASMSEDASAPASPALTPALSDSTTLAEVRSPGRGGSGSSAADDDAFLLDPAADGWDAAARLAAWLRRHNLRLSPRALTLTAVLRLLVADQFVHGIGGARYDQVLDTLIARHFKLEPPRFCVTTATLYFPDAAGQPRACVPCVVQEGHRLRHRVLGDAKMRLVEAIVAAPRGSADRATLFHEMHDQLAAAQSLPAVRAWSERLRETAEREQQERVLFDRELFYAIQPRERLAEMIGHYRDAF